MPCPNCGSDDWKLASLVYRDGLHNIETTSKGGGVGIGSGGIGVGVGKGSTSGIQQSALSQAAAPPVDPTGDKAGMLAVGIGLAIAIIGGIAKGSYFWGLFVAFPVGLLVGLVVAYIVAMTADNTKYEAQLRTWQQIRMCQRCGTFYLPEQ